MELRFRFLIFVRPDFLFARRVPYGSLRLPHLTAGIIEGAKDGKGRGRQVIAGKSGSGFVAETRLKSISNPIQQSQEHAI
jgi:hypothetical protein